MKSENKQKKSSKKSRSKSPIPTPDGDSDNDNNDNSQNQLDLVDFKVYENVIPHGFNDGNISLIELQSEKIDQDSMNQIKRDERMLLQSYSKLDRKGCNHEEIGCKEKHSFLPSSLSKQVNHQNSTTAIAAAQAQAVKSMQQLISQKHLRHKKFCALALKEKVLKGVNDLHIIRSTIKQFMQSEKIKIKRISLQYRKQFSQLMQFIEKSQEAKQKQLKSYKQQIKLLQMANQKLQKDTSNSAEVAAYKEQIKKLTKQKEKIQKQDKQNQKKYLKSCQDLKIIQASNKQLSDENQAIQEQLFDLQQKLVGIDLEVEKRLDVEKLKIEDKIKGELSLVFSKAQNPNKAISSGQQKQKSRKSSEQQQQQLIQKYEYLKRDKQYFEEKCKNLQEKIFKYSSQHKSYQQNQTIAKQLKDKATRLSQRQKAISLKERELKLKQSSLEQEWQKLQKSQRLHKNKQLELNTQLQHLDKRMTSFKESSQRKQKDLDEVQMSLQLRKSQLDLLQSKICNNNSKAIQSSSSKIKTDNRLGLQKRQQHLPSPFKHQTKEDNDYEHVATKNKDQSNRLSPRVYTNKKDTNANSNADLKKTQSAIQFSQQSAEQRKSSLSSASANPMNTTNKLVPFDSLQSPSPSHQNPSPSFQSELFYRSNSKNNPNNNNNNNGLSPLRTQKSSQQHKSISQYRQQHQQHDPLSPPSSVKRQQRMSSNVRKYFIEHEKSKDFQEQMKHSRANSRSNSKTNSINSAIRERDHSIASRYGKSPEASFKGHGKDDFKSKAKHQIADLNNLAHKLESLKTEINGQIDSVL